MAYDEYLADRARTQLQQQGVDFRELEMMGGLCFMVDEKMCFGIIDDMLMARIDPEEYEELLSKEHVREMNYTGRAMKGFLFIEPDGLDMEGDLDYWVDKCLEFNPKAKSSR